MEQKLIEKITQEVNSRSKRYTLGKLQSIRKEILPLKRLSNKDIFPSRPKFDDWVCHHGGRKELQFNIGLESSEVIDQVRFGVAFALQPSQSLPDINILRPNIKLFNDYMESHPEEFSDMRMWHDRDGRRTYYDAPSIIDDELIAKDVFIFLGVQQPRDDLDYDCALDVMDRLLPLYLYTETKGNIKKSKIFDTSQSFQFVPGCTPKLSTATASYPPKQMDIELRHNDIQKALHQQLSGEYGIENVGTEISSGRGTSVDLVVKQKPEYWFYEIKTAHTAKKCIRQAIGQLLEYSYWPNNQEATRLVIVGKPIMDEEARKYIEKLRSQFTLPIYYESIEG